MTIWQPDLTGRTGPRYLALADAIADAIRSGDLAAGSRLPPQRELAWRLNVTVGTVGRAYGVAEQRGLLSGEVGRGTFVRARGAAPSAPEATGPEPVDLTRNGPGSGGSGAALAATLQRLAAGRDLDWILPYGPDAGHEQHRAAGAAWIGRCGLQVPAEQVILTNGAQQALVVALSALSAPGERVLCEQLTYCGLLDAARLLPRRLDGLAMDREGVLPEALDEACRAAPARLLCLTPTVHNPTTATMSLARREAIVALMRRHDLLLIEDDVYGFLPAQRPPPIAALAPERTIYLASASKCITAGLRVGWIAAPPALAQPLADALNALALAVSALPAEILRQWIADGTVDRLAASQREECAARQALAAEVFAGFESRSDPASFHILLTLPEPWRAQEFAAAARARGVLVVPAGTFAVGQAEAPHAVRVSLAAAPDREILRRALTVLADLALSSPGARRAVI